METRNVGNNGIQAQSSQNMEPHSTIQRTPVVSQAVDMNAPQKSLTIPVGAVGGSVFGVVFVIILLAVTITLVVILYRRKHGKRYKLGRTYSKQGSGEPSVHR